MVRDSRFTSVDAFSNGWALVPTDLATASLLRAIHSGATTQDWRDHNAESVPVHTSLTGHGKGAIHVSMRAHKGVTSESQHLLNSLWERVRALDDLCSDVLLVFLAQWVGSTAGRCEPVWIHADTVLDARGIRRVQWTKEPGHVRHGHRREDRLAVGHAVDRLDGLWLEMREVAVIPGGKGSRPRTISVESKALALLDRVMQRDFNGNEVFLAARVMPGTWAEEYQTLGLRQVGLLAQKAIQYHVLRQRPEKRLAKFLAFHARVNAHRQAGVLPLHASTLVENAGLEVDALRPKRARDRLEAALGQLRTDEIIANWSYRLNPDTRRLGRRWFASWLKTTILIELAVAVPDRSPELRGSAWRVVA